MGSNPTPAVRRVPAARLAEALQPFGWARGREGFLLQPLTGLLVRRRLRRMWVRLAIAVGVAVALGGGAAEADTSGVNEFAFLSERGGVSSVVLAHGGKTTTLARNADGPPTWFRDGRRLAYAAAGRCTS